MNNPFSHPSLPKKKNKARRWKVDWHRALTNQPVQFTYARKMIVATWITAVSIWQPRNVTSDKKKAYSLLQGFMMIQNTVELQEMKKKRQIEIKFNRLNRYLGITSKHFTVWSDKQGYTIYVLREINNR